jgi:hypothetical protein
MSKHKKICDIDLAIDSNNHWDVDLLDFCLDQSNAGLTKDTPLGGPDLDDAAFEVI